MNTNEVIEITQEEAIKAVEAVEAEKIHCFLGSFGADWSKESIVGLIKKSERIAWADNMFNHNLVVINENERYCFDIKY